MGVFRVHKTQNYTVMSNTHLRERNMSLKAKGLLCYMLSLPEEWDYSIAGLVAMCKENETAITTALKELKEFGYIKIKKLFPQETESGRIEYEYEIYEEPHKQEPKNQESEKQESEKQEPENQGLEKQGQINTNRRRTKEKSINKQSTNKTSKSARARDPQNPKAKEPDFSKTNFTDAMKTSVMDWLQYKKERREGYKETGLKALITEIVNNVTRYGESAVMGLMAECMSSNYQGIIWDRLKKQPEKYAKADRNRILSPEEYDSGEDFLSSIDWDAVERQQNQNGG